MEVSSRGLYKHDPPLLYPSEWVIKEAFIRNVPVMINSDAHHPDEIDYHFAGIARLLLQTGYKTLRVLRQGTWQDRLFSEAGILY
jgi:histidinol-phosphatase (PHP family)